MKLKINKKTINTGIMGFNLKSVLLFLIPIFLYGFYIFPASIEPTPGQDEKLKTELQIFLKQLDSNNDIFRQRAKNELLRMGYEIVPVLRESLKDPKSPGRNELPLILAEIGDQSVIPDLIPLLALKDKDIKLSQNVAESLRLFSNPISVPGLIDALGNPDVDEKVKVIILKDLVEITTHNYGRFSEKWKQWWDANKNSVIRGFNEISALCDNPEEIPKDEALASLYRKMNDLNPEIRSRAIKEFFVLENPEKVKFIPLLTKMVKDPLDSVRLRTVRNIGKIRNPAGILVLSNIIKTSDDPNSLRIRQEAIMAISEIGDIRGVPPIMQLIDENNPPLKFLLSQAYFRFADTLSEDEIVQNIKSWNTYIQRFCIKVAFQRRIYKAIPIIENIIKDDDDQNVQREAIRTIADFKSKSSISVLIDILTSNKEPVLVGDALLLLPIISGEDKGLNAEDWIKWWEQNWERISMEVISENELIKKAKSAEKDATLYSRDWQRRLSRIREISMSEDENLICSLIPFMENDPVWLCRHEAQKYVIKYYSNHIDNLFNKIKCCDKVEREKARKILLSSGDKFLPQIHKWLESDNFFAQKICAEILGKLKSKESIDPLINAIANSYYKGIPPSPFAIAISNFSSEAVPKLIPLLSSRSGEVSTDAFFALSKMHHRYLCEAIPFVIEKLKSNDIFVKEEAERVLFEITEQEFVMQQQAREWKDKLIKKYPDISATKTSSDEALVHALLREKKDLLNTQLNNFLSPDAYVFQRAKKYIFENADQETLARLFEMYKNGNPVIRETIITLLLSIPDLSYPIILNNINSNDPSNQECALIIAEKWERHKDFIATNEILKQCLLSMNRQIRRSAVPIIVNFELPENIQFLVRALKDSDPVIQAEAARGLALMNEPLAISDMRKSLQNIMDPLLRLKIAESLATFGDFSGATYFQTALTSLNYELIRQSITLFPTVLSPAFEEPLINAIKNTPEKEDFKKNLIIYLGYIGGQKASEFLPNTKPDGNVADDKNLLRAIEMIKTNQLIFN